MKKTILALPSILLCVGSLLSEVALADEQEARVFADGVGATTLDRAVSAPSGIELMAAQGSSQASIKLSRSFSDGSHKAPGEYGRAIFSTWSLTASAPLSKSSDDTDIATLDALVHASSLEAKYSRFSVPDLRRPDLSDPEVSARMQHLCAELRRSYKEKTGKSEADAIAQECDLGNAKLYLPDRYGDFRSLYWKPSGMRVVWGASAKVGYQNFDFVNTTSGKEESRQETPWSVGLFLGLNPAQWKTLFTLSGQYQEAFKDAKSGVQCLPGEDGTLLCASGPLGSPKHVTKKLVALEARRAFRFASVALTATYDFEAEVFGVDLPVYLVKGKDGKLSGGVRLGWRDDTDDFTAGVFVGAGFGVFE